MTLELIPCLLLSMLLSAAHAPRSTEKAAWEKERQRIDRYASRIRGSKLPKHAVDVDCIADRGCSMMVYGTSATPKRIHIRTGLSSDVVTEDYYFTNGKLVLVTMKREAYPYDQRRGGLVYDAKRLEQLGQYGQYFRNGRLISTWTSNATMKDYCDGDPQGKHSLQFAAFMLKHWSLTHLDWDLQSGRLTAKGDPLRPTSGDPRRHKGTRARTRVE